MDIFHRNPEPENDAPSEASATPAEPDQEIAAAVEAAAAVVFVPSEFAKGLRLASTLLNAGGQTHEVLLERAELTDADLIAAYDASALFEREGTTTTTDQNVEE